METSRVQRKRRERPNRNVPYVSARFAVENLPVANDENHSKRIRVSLRPKLFDVSYIGRILRDPAFNIANKFLEGDQGEELPEKVEPEAN